MSLISRFKITNESEKARAVKRLVIGSTPDYDFFFLVVLSVLMATIGLLTNNAIVVIGSMLIAPILYPVISLSMGVSMSDYSLTYRSLYTLLKSFLLVVGLAVFTTLMFAGNFNPQASEIIERTQPSLAYFMVAVFSGLAVSYALFRPNLSETFPGIAVSVALLPPMAVVGIGLAQLDLNIMVGALQLFALNVLGIMTACLFIFSMVDVRDKQNIAVSEIRKEEKRVRDEIEAIKEMDEANEDQTKNEDITSEVKVNNQNHGT